MDVGLYENDTSKNKKDETRGQVASIRSIFAFGFMNLSNESICLVAFVGGFSEQVLVHIVNKVKTRK